MVEPPSLRIETTDYQVILAHLTASLPEEACGLLGGQFSADGHALVQAVLPVENELHSTVRFRMAPAAQLQAFLWLEEHGMELVGIFHSHPKGPPAPSVTDLEEFMYPGVMVVIVSPTPSGWVSHCFHIQDQRSIEVPLIVLPTHLSNLDRDSGVMLDTP